MPRKTKMNSITSPELLAQVNPANQELERDFLDYLKSIQRSSGTISGYQNDLNIFFVWVLQYAKNKSFVDITKRDLVAYQNWLLNENNNSPSRVRRLKAAISSLSNFVENILDEEREYAGFRSIVKKIENPALQSVREKTVWEEDELEDLLKMLVEKGKYEKACLVALAMYGGRRKAELCRFKVSDFDDDKLVCDGALYKSSPILTKGNKYLECYTLAKKFKPYLDLWMNYREQNGIDSEWLFVSPANNNDPIEITTLNSWANTFSRMTQRDFYFHSLRHYYCTALVKAGIPDSVVIDIIGWSSSEMLKIYDDSPKDEKISMYFKDGDISIPEKKGLDDV